MSILNMQEAADYLKICKSTLYKKTSLGAIAFTKPNGKLIYFRKEDLDNYLNKGRVDAIEVINSKKGGNHE